jgi:predicted DNA-binding protein (UPF0251 family)
MTMARKPKPKDEAPVTRPALPAVALPPGQLVERDGRDATVITAAGLEAVRILAAVGRTQNSIAASLGIGRAAFKGCMDRQEAVRLAWEAGNAEDEQYWMDVLRRAAADGAFIPAMFILKARFGYRENDAPQDARPNITIVLPDALSPEQYLKTIGVQERPAITKAVDDEPRPSTGGLLR